MTIKRSLLITFGLLFLNLGFSQDSKANTSSIDFSKTPFLDRTEFKVSYFGNIIANNGLNFGAEYLLKEYQKVKTRRGKERTNTHQFLLNGALGFSTNIWTTTETGVFTNYGITWRRINKKNKQFSISLNPLGYYRSFLPETFEVVGDNVEQVFLPGRGYYAPSIAVGIGRNRPGKKITGRFFNVNLMLRTPYNAGTLPTFNLEYGFRFKFKKNKNDAENNN